jgi:flagellar hook-associated protein 2
MSTTGAISGGIKWTGLASGTDFGSIVDKLVAIEQRAITRQENWKAEWQEKITAISGLNTRLVTLKLDAQDKDLRSELLSRVTTVSDEKVVSVKNTSTAALGNYDITVGEKTSEKFASRSYEKGKIIEVDPAIIGTTKDKLIITVGDPDEPSGVKTFEFAPTPTPTSVDTLAATGYYSYGTDSSLKKLAKEINQLTAGQGIKASVIDDKSGYERLILVSENAGSDYRINVVQDPTDIGLGGNWACDAVYSTFLGSGVDIKVNNASYKGAVNKTFTFVPTNSGVLGTDPVTVQWADTEGHSGKFTLEAGTVPQTVTVMQGLELTFDTGSNGTFVANEAFSVDCQAPVLQKGQDTGLAQSDKVVHSGFVDLVSPIHTGGSTEFVYTYRGEERRVMVTDRMSLSLLADAINNASDNPGVQASVVNDGTGTATAYHLILTGDDTGAENVIEVKSAAFSTGAFDASTFSKAREATNCMVKVDGFPAGDENWIQRPKNELADAIEGVVVTVTGTGSSTLSVRNDAEGMRDKIVQLVNSVNYCKSYIIEYTKWGESNLEVNMDDSGTISTSRENANGIMIGNYGFQISQSILDSLMTKSPQPYSANPALDTKGRLEFRQKKLEEYGLTAYSSLADIGITSDPENQGLYKVEQSKLLDCINTDPEAVIRLITIDETYVDKNAEGKDETVKVQGLAVALNEMITKITSDTDTYDTAGNLVQKSKGIMVTLQENYESIIENINEKIAREERRIEMVRQRLTDKFNRLETSLQSLEDTQSQLESSISSLDSGSS